MHNLLNIFITLIFLAAIASLAWWIIEQAFSRWPEVVKWLKIFGGVILLVFLVYWMTGGIQTYPFFR